MAYNGNIPQASNQISRSQKQILDNFTELNTYTAIDHESFAVGANAGKHRKLTFVAQAAPAAVAATESGIYAANGPTSGTPELFINKTATQVPFTESLLVGLGGWTYLPSGLILQWGTDTAAAGASHTFNLPRAFPTAFYAITATPNAVPGGAFTDNIISIVALGLNQATLNRKTNFGSNCTFSFFAIGR